VSGSVRRGRRAGTWELRLSAGVDPLTGRYRIVSRTIEGGRRDADRALAELAVEVGRGGHTGASVTFAELLDSWLDLVGDRLSPTILDHYRGYASRYLKPALGIKPVRRTTSRDLDRLYLAMSRDRGLAPRTVRQAHAVARGAPTSSAPSSTARSPQWRLLGNARGERPGRLATRDRGHPRT